MTKTSSASLAERITLEAFALGRAVRYHMSSHAKPHQNGVNFLQIHALLAIGEHEGLTMKEAAKHLHVTSPSATSFVDRIVKSGWVERCTDPDNRKLVRLKLTESGHAMLEEKKRERVEMIRAVLEELPVADQRDLARILPKLVRLFSPSLPSRSR